MCIEEILIKSKPSTDDLSHIYHIKQSKPIYLLTMFKYDNSIL